MICIRRPDSASQTALTVVGDRDRVRRAVIRKDREDRTENLLPRDRHRIIDIPDDCRPDERALVYPLASSL